VKKTNLQNLTLITADFFMIYTDKTLTYQ